MPPAVTSIVHVGHQTSSGSAFMSTTLMCARTVSAVVVKNVSVMS